MTVGWYYLELQEQQSSLENAPFPLSSGGFKGTSREPGPRVWAQQPRPWGAETSPGSSTSCRFCAEAVQTRLGPGWNLPHLPWQTRAVFIGYDQTMFFLFPQFACKPFGGIHITF